MTGSDGMSLVGQHKANLARIASELYWFCLFPVSLQPFNSQTY